MNKYFRYSQDLEEYADALALNGPVDFVSRINSSYLGNLSQEDEDNKEKDSMEVVYNGVMNGKEQVAKTQITFQ